jgi:hypothetical protein
MAGYEVTLDDFRQLICHPPYQPSTAALLKEWYDYEISGAGSAAVVRSMSGDVVDIPMLHERIQADPGRQYSLYQSAMALWR